MKKINSIGYGGKVILCGIILFVILPSILSFIPTHGKLIPLISNLSKVIGAILLIGFTIVLLIELHQDKKIDKQYEKVKYKKIQISKDQYECQACGYCKVNDKDKFCKVCGVHFIEKENEISTKNNRL